MAIVATNLKRGQCIKYEGERGIVLGLEHRTPGKGNALIAATIRSFNSGKTKTTRFASSEKVEIVDTDRQKLEFSYSEPGTYHFMDMQTFETTGLVRRIDRSAGKGSERYSRLGQCQRRGFLSMK